MKSYRIEILDNMPEFVLLEDEVGNIIYANQAFCQCFGVTNQEIAGVSIFDYIIPDDREKCNVEAVVTPEEPDYVIEGRSKRIDGNIIWIQWVGRAFFDTKGRRTGFQEIGVDITQWKEKIEKNTRELVKANEKLMEINATGGNNRKRFQQKIHNGSFLATYQFSDIYTQNVKMKVLIAYAKAVAAGDVTILIEGESGTGKELFAQAIHNASKRKEGPFVAVNCGVIPAELVGSEFFGYVDGAFTGAAKGGKAGKFEMASGGTLFLDEIGEMPLTQQVALLRVLETRAISRIGDDKMIPVDVRIICATNKNLLEEVNNGSFRADLYYRLNVINLQIPPLRERKEDIILLLSVFMEKYGEQNFDREKMLSERNLMALHGHNWQGNVRELQNVVERMMYLPKEDVDTYFDNILRRTDAPVPVSMFPGENWQMSYPAQETDGGNAAKMTKAQEAAAIPGKTASGGEEERERIRSCLEDCENNISMAARKLGISRNTLYKRMKNYNLDVKGGRK